MYLFIPGLPLTINVPWGCYFESDNTRLSMQVLIQITNISPTDAFAIYEEETVNYQENTRLSELSREYKTSSL